MATVIVSAFAAAAVALGWTLYARYELQRPPVGVFNDWDLGLMLAGIVCLPLVYLVAPAPLVGVLFCAVALNLLNLGIDPIVRIRGAAWALAALLVAVDASVVLACGATSLPGRAVGDVELVLLAAVAANVLAQSGMRASTLARLAALLTVYDVVATSRLSLMTQLLTRLAPLPFAPLVVWPGGGGRALGLGLGDVFVLTLTPLVLRKAYGRTAGIVAAVVGVAAAAVVLALLQAGVLRFAVPLIAVLGPLLVAQHLWWRRRRGGERPTWQFVRDEVPRRRTRLSSQSPVFGKEVTS